MFKRKMSTSIVFLLIITSSWLINGCANSERPSNPTVSVNPKVSEGKKEEPIKVAPKVIKVTSTIKPYAGESYTSNTGIGIVHIYEEGDSVYVVSADNIRTPEGNILSNYVISISKNGKWEIKDKLLVPAQDLKGKDYDLITPTFAGKSVYFTSRAKDGCYLLYYTWNDNGDIIRKNQEHTTVMTDFYGVKTELGQGWIKTQVSSPGTKSSIIIDEHLKDQPITTSTNNSIYSHTFFNVNTNKLYSGSSANWQASIIDTKAGEPLWDTNGKEKIADIEIESPYDPRFEAGGENRTYIASKSKSSMDIALYDENLNRLSDIVKIPFDSFGFYELTSNKEELHLWGSNIFQGKPVLEQIIIPKLK